MPEIEEMIEEIDKACNKTTSIVHFFNWELSSYEDDSLFCIPNTITSGSFEGLIKAGYERVKERRKQ